jgi:peptide/nickel transport system substrate-binding protein
MNRRFKVLAALGVISGIVAVAVAAVPNNTLVLMQSADIPTLDPGEAYDTASYEPIENIYETLVAYKGQSASELTGALATDWKISGDGKTYTFNLRKNVKFHSGNAFSCDDAQYTLQRNVVTNHSDSGNWYLADALLATQSNANDDKGVTWDKISKSTACNKDGQLVLTLPKPDPALLVKLAADNMSIVDKKWAIGLGEWDGTEKTWKDWVGKDLTDSELNKKPSGTGAYQLVKRDPNQLVFKSFDGYWGGKPKIENVIMQIVKEQATRLEALKKGDADIVETGPRSVLTQLQGVPNLKIYDGIANNASTIMFMNQKINNPENLGSGKLDGKGIPANFFSDLNVRKGFAYSFDYDRYIKEVQVGKGTKRTMALPDIFFGYDKNVKQYGYNPEFAKANFQKAFGGDLWKNGFVLQARYRAGSPAAQTAMEILKANVEKLSPKFKVELSAKPWSEFLKDSAAGKEAMVILGWAPDYADPDNFIRTFYHSEGFYHPRLNFKDDQTDKLIDQASATTDKSKRAVLYSLVGQRGYELCPFVLMPAAVGFLVYNANLKGIEENYNIMLSGSTGSFWKNASK